MKYLDFLEDAFLTLSLLVMGVILLLQIVMRYFLNNPLVWSEELARYIFVWMTFIGASYAVKHKTHISMNLLFNKMSRPLKLALTIFKNLLAVAVFLVIGVTGWELALDQVDVSSAAMGISMVWFFSAFPVACILMSFRLVLQTIGAIRTGGREL